ncbi:hypothetical protein F5X71_08000 [Nocardia brasiliensis]|uniref:NTP pyrophosphohydrolase n=1 Tax=Nocardia brasiliensis TaxID=37326 RepID=A0A6G9XN42_NOCBR|nr:hypothetical protein [Nocardia brasiliensis]QIS02270.1 hypothetical protein F5X71_08000 [Nocardia brasiliensis]
MVTDDLAQLIVVDAANVVGSRPDGWWRDRAGAARRLLDKLTALDQRLAEPAEVVVVLEGAAKAAATDAPDALRVVAALGSGDDAIVEVVLTAVQDDIDRPVIVVTADRGLRERVESLGADTIGPSWLLDLLEHP